MNKKYKELMKHRHMAINEDADDLGGMLRDLEQAWETLPDDLYSDERSFFFDLVERVAKTHNTLKNTSDFDNLTKN